VEAGLTGHGATMAHALPIEGDQVTDSNTADSDRTTESADMIESPLEGDPADLAGTAADGTADKMHDEVDQIAEDADTTSAGHGPVQDDPDKN